MQSKYTGFPQGFEHLETVFQPLRARIDQINNEIDNMPSDRGYRPDFRPAGAPPAPPEISRVDRINALSAEKETIQNSMQQVAREAIRNAYPHVAKEVMDKTEILAHPEKYEIGKEQAYKEINSQKDINRAQDSASRLYFDAKYLKPDIDEKRPENKGSLKESIDKFFDDTTSPKNSITQTQEPEILKDKNVIERKGAKEAFEKSMEKFFDETSLDYVDNREDILSTDDPSLDPEKDR